MHSSSALSSIPRGLMFIRKWFSLPTYTEGETAELNSPEHMVPWIIVSLQITWIMQEKSVYHKGFLMCGAREHVWGGAQSSKKNLLIIDN